MNTDINFQVFKTIYSSLGFNPTSLYTWKRMVSIIEFALTNQHWHHAKASVLYKTNKQKTNRHLHFKLSMLAKTSQRYIIDCTPSPCSLQLVLLLTVNVHCMLSTAYAPSNCKSSLLSTAYAPSNSTAYAPCNCKSSLLSTAYAPCNCKSSLLSTDNPLSNWKSSLHAVHSLCSL